MRRRLAPAKLNLFLRVLGRRPDGYHELRTVFEPLDLADELAFEPAPPAAGLHLDLQHEAPGPPAPAGRENLVLRAAEAFQAKTGRRLGGRFALVKRVPAGAGLGGGSSDAAAALLLLAAAAGLPPTAETMEILHEIAAGLGADVAFFLDPGRAVGAGRGERLSALPAGRPLHHVLLFPGWSIRTRAVYDRLSAPPLRVDCSQDVPGSITRPPLSASRRQTPGESLSAWGAFDPGGPPPGGDEALCEPVRGLFNDLEPAACAAQPRLARLFTALAEAGLPAARLSGSGSTLFWSFRGPGAARAFARRLAATRPGWAAHLGEEHRIYVTRTFCP